MVLTIRGCLTSLIICMIFDNADYISIGNYLSNIDWLIEFGACTSAADVWIVYCNHIIFVLSTHVPRKYLAGARKTRNAKYSTHYPSFIRKLPAQKLRAWYKSKSIRDNSLKTVYFKAASDLRCAIFYHHRHIEDKIINTRNIGAFYKHINRKLACKSGDGSIKKPDRTLCVIDQEKADILNDYFGSVWVDDDGAYPIFPSRVPSDTFIDDISFTSLSFFKTLSNLKNGSAAGEL